MKNAKRARTLPCGRAPFEHDSVKPTSERMEQWQAQLREFLTREGLKHSDQRWKIAELILQTGGHLDAQQIVERVKEKHPEIGAATVYRNLKVLCDASILKESLMDPQGRVVYELFDDHHHDHIICLDCGEIFEFHSDRIEDLQSSIARNMDFSEVRHRHVIFAKCTYGKR